MKQDVTLVYVHFQGIERGKRKPKFQILRVDKVEGHKTFNNDEMNLLERKAWLAIDDLNYRMTSETAKLVVNHGDEDEGMLTVMLMPKQTQTIIRR